MTISKRKMRRQFESNPLVLDYFFLGVTDRAVIAKLQKSHSGPSTEPVLVPVLVPVLPKLFHYRSGKRAVPEPVPNFPKQRNRYQSKRYFHSKKRFREGTGSTFGTGSPLVYQLRNRFRTARTGSSAIPGRELCCASVARDRVRITFAESLKSPKKKEKCFCFF